MGSVPGMDDQFEQIIEGVELEPAPVGFLRDSVTEDWLDATGRDDDPQAERVIRWTIDNLREYFGPGMFDLFVQASWEEATLIQPRLSEHTQAPVSVALRSARETIEYAGHKKELRERAIWQLLQDLSNDDEDPLA